MSGRGLTTETAAALDAPHVTYFPLVDLDLATGHIYIAGTPFDVTHDGNVYQTVHGLGSIDVITETDAEQAGLKFTLSAVSTAAIASALTVDIQGRPVTVRMAVLDGTTLRVDAVAWQGLLDIQRVIDGPQPYVTVTAEHMLVHWEESAGLLYSDADQQALYPGDKFFEFTAAISQASIAWPTAEALRAEAGG